MRFQECGLVFPLVFVGLERCLKVHLRFFFSLDSGGDLRTLGRSLHSYGCDSAGGVSGSKHILFLNTYLTSDHKYSSVFSVFIFAFFFLQNSGLLFWGFIIFF